MPQSSKAKKSAPIFSPLQRKVNNVFFGFFMLIGVGLIIASSVYSFYVLRPRVIGNTAQAQATNYRTFNAHPDSGKYVDYSFMADGRQYTGSAEISKKAYAEKAPSFTVWYVSEDSKKNSYASIRDYGDIMAAAIGVVIGALFLYLPFWSRKIDTKLQADGITSKMPGCICGAAPKSVITVNELSRKSEKIKGSIFLGIAVVILFITLTDGWMLDFQSIALLAAFAFFYVIPMISRWPKTAKHSIRCRFRFTWFSALYS